MFGYIVIHKDELKVKDYNRYNSFYCGVCRSLRNNYGLPGQITLNYDMTFLAILLSGLYEDDTKTVMRHCIIHHVKKHGEISNEYTDYAAAMNILLSYYKLKDNWNDDKSLKSNIGAGLLKKSSIRGALKCLTNTLFFLRKSYISVPFTLPCLAKIKLEPDSRHSKPNALSLPAEHFLVSIIFSVVLL